MARLGPDAQRYLAAGDGQPQTRPFHVRWVLPALCGTDLRAWWLVYCLSWPMLAAGTVLWAVHGDLSGIRIGAAVLLILGLPGILGPSVSIPVQADLPATALTAIGTGLILSPIRWVQLVGWATLLLATNIRETVPIVAALWLWSPIPLILLVSVAITWWIRPQVASSGIPEWDWIAAHPIRAGLKYHAGRWRDARLMVVPWGADLAAIGNLSPRLALTLIVAYAQLFVATDSVRLYQHVAAIPMTIAAVTFIPTAWLPVALIAHWFWLYQPERI